MTPTGRFAPSPSGPLHAGSLLAALGSFLDARSRNGRWLVRIDDLDPLRARAHATDDILHGLAAHGLHHDGPVRYESTRQSNYAAALEQLWQHNQVYACACTRAVLREQRTRDQSPLYPGTCRDRSLPATGHACRIRVDSREVSWQSTLGETQTECVSQCVGDFVLKRRDGIFAYQLAVVVDDEMDAVTSVVRGQDLEDNTGRQVYLQHSLGLGTPDYLHLPVVTGPDGRKLSKSNGAKAINPEQALFNLTQAWQGLRQTPITSRFTSTGAFLSWAIRNWQPQRASQGLSPTQGSA